MHTVTMQYSSLVGLNWPQGLGIESGYSRVHIQVSFSVSVVTDIITFIETGVIYIGDFYAVIDLANASLTIPLANEDQD